MRVARGTEEFRPLTGLGGAERRTATPPRANQELAAHNS